MSNKRNVLFLSLAVLIIGVINIAVWQRQSHELETTNPQNSYLRADGKSTFIILKNTASSHTILWPIFVCTVGILFLTLLLVGLWMHFSRKAARNRDATRRTDLNTLATGFEKYYQARGHYPISSIYESTYCEGLNFTTDWAYYGMPDTDEMHQFISDWPICDPHYQNGAKNQLNRYIYFPRDNGGRFDLYAHLEMPAKGAPNYTVEDNLPEAWGTYNFKISSVDEHASQDGGAISLVNDQFNLASKISDNNSSSSDTLPAFNQLTDGPDHKPLASPLPTDNAATNIDPNANHHNPTVTTPEILPSTSPEDDELERINALFSSPAQS
jgi:hypothetical protein